MGYANHLVQCTVNIIYRYSKPFGYQFVVLSAWFFFFHQVVSEVPPVKLFYFVCS